MLESKGTPVGAFDIMIASQAVANDLTVVTHNTKDFSVIPNIKLEDWTEG